MTARKTSASASDLRLWLTPMLVVMETVNRLAARVNNSSMSHAKIPALVNNGSRAVEITAEPRRIRPKAQIVINNSGLVQVLVLVIVRVPRLGELRAPPRAARVHDEGAKRRAEK